MMENFAEKMTGQCPQKLKWIVAATQENGIGINGNLPWRLVNDMKFFAHVTEFHGRSDMYGNTDTEKPWNVCIMGRKTWISIPPKFRPLKGRMNIVLSRQSFQNEENVVFVKTFEEALDWIQENQVSITWVIGGAQLYKLSLPYTDQIFLTRVSNESKVECDTFLDLDLKKFRRLSDIEYTELLGKTAPIGVLHEKEYEYEFQIWNKL
jgi:dihydrofolate reductase